MCSSLLKLWEAFCGVPPMQSEYGIKSQIYFIVNRPVLQAKICRLILCSIAKKKAGALQRTGFYLFFYYFIFTGDSLFKLGHKHGREDTDDAEDDENPAHGRLEQTHNVAAADS